MSYQGLGRDGSSPDGFDEQMSSQLFANNINTLGNNQTSFSFPNSRSFDGYHSNVFEDSFPSKKRPISAASTDSVNNDEGNLDSGSNKKRFVWPESLHRDFIAAVFDVGLKFATIKEIQSAMNVEKGLYTQDQLKSHFQKFRVYRDRKKFPRKLFYEMECNGVDDTNIENLAQDIFSSSIIAADTQLSSRIPHSDLLKMASGDTPVTGEDLDAAERSCANHLTLVREKLEKVQQAIKSQTLFMESMKYSLEDQSKLYANMNSILESVDIATATTDDITFPHITSALHAKHLPMVLPILPAMLPVETNALALGPVVYSNATPTHIPVVATTVVPAAASSRAEVRIMSEMRATMDLHRKLLLQREDQLSMHYHTSHHHHHNAHQQPLSADPSLSADSYLVHHPSTWTTQSLHPHQQAHMQQQQHLYDNNAVSAVFPVYHLQQSVHPHLTQQHHQQTQPTHHISQQHLQQPHQQQYIENSTSSTSGSRQIPGDEAIDTNQLSVFNQHNPATSLIAFSSNSMPPPSNIIMQKSYNHHYNTNGNDLQNQQHANNQHYNQQQQHHHTTHHPAAPTRSISITTQMLESLQDLVDTTPGQSQNQSRLSSTGSHVNMTTVANFITEMSEDLDRVGGTDAKPAAATSSNTTAAASQQPFANTSNANNNASNTLPHVDSANFDPDSVDGDALFSFLLTSG